MSKQLSISVAVSTLVMALFALSATPNVLAGSGSTAPGGLAAPTLSVSIR